MQGEERCSRSSILFKTMLNVDPTSLRQQRRFQGAATSVLVFLNSKHLPGICISLHKQEGKEVTAGVELGL